MALALLFAPVVGGIGLLVETVRRVLIIAISPLIVGAITGRPGRTRV